MKTLITLFIVSIPVFGFTQNIEFNEKYIKVIAKNDMSVSQAFDLTDAIPGPQKVLNRFVVKDGATYYRAGINIFNKVYKINDIKAFDKINNAGLFTIRRLERKGLITRSNI